MVDETKSKQTAPLCDDILQYEQGQARNTVEDPLSAIKTMRLEQLVVCRLKSGQKRHKVRDDLDKVSK